MKKVSPTPVIVLATGVVMAILNSISFFVSVTRTPAQTVYLGTIHYWEDYFFYLNHFFQGARGEWLTANRYTPEPTQETIIYWSNIAAGKILGVFGLPHIVAYNVTILILTFTAVIFTYLLVRAVLKDRKDLVIPAFLIAVLSTSLQNRVRSSEGPMVFWPFQIWKTPHFAFDRLGGAPHQILITILTYAVILAYFAKTRSGKTARSYLFIAVSAVLLASIQPVQALATAAAIAGAEIISRIINRKPNSLPVAKLAAVLLSTGSVSFYMYGLLNLEPHVQTKIWEASQHSYTTPVFLLLSIGPASLLGIIGAASRLKKLTAVEMTGLLLIVAGYVMFMTRIPQTIGISNSRLLFPAFYAFWGVFGAYGISRLATLAQRISGFPKKTATVLITLIFVAVSVPTIAWEVYMKLPKPADAADPLIYLPADVHEGFTSLSKIGSYDDTVVANPSTRMDSLVPALSGHTAYSGHMLATTDNPGKQDVARRFFSLQLDPRTARAWMMKEKIRYTLFTKYDGDRHLFEATYPYLKRIFSNQSTALYETGR